ncbi:histidine kinase [Pedobacter sp. UBA4863]|uniref:sensor histidine kinase n=1 Tax=Pedobacter sp. UBA4863 TaxID=1947060 RepID=UPI0025E1D869|nr:histidine kinase [Pedobacter sp. UBA4863]
MYLPKNLFTVLLIFLGQYAFGQDPYYYIIDKSKGLPSNSVYDIFQDKKGYIWFATDEGLCRYNGTTFKTYFSDEQTSRAGSCIGEDKYGRIWYSNFDGYLYYVQNGKLRALKNKNPIGYFKYGITDDYLYQITKQGVAVYDLKTLKPYSHIAINEVQLSSSDIVKNKFYVLTSALYEIEEGEKTRKIALPTDFYEYLGHSIILQPSAQGMLFLSKLLGFNYLLLPNGKFVKQQRPSHLSFVQNVSYTDSNFWLATPKGVFQNLQNQNYQPYFKAFNISATFKDNRGNYWFSTLNRGVLLVPDLKNMLLEMQPRPVRMSAVKNGIVTSTEDERIYRFNLNDYSKKLLYKGESNHAINQLYADSLGNHIMFTSNRFIWLDENNKVKKQVHVAVKDVKRVDDSYFSFAASGYSGIFKIGKSNKTSDWDSLFLSEQPKSPGNFTEVGLFREINGKATVFNSCNKTLYYATNVGLFYRTPQLQDEIKHQNNSLYFKLLESYKTKVYGLATNGRVHVIDSLNKVSELRLNIKDDALQASKIKLIGQSLYIMTLSDIYEYDLIKDEIVNHTNLGHDFEISDIERYRNYLVFATAKGILLQNNKPKQMKNYTSLVLEGVIIKDSVFAVKELESLKYWQNNIDIRYSLLAYTPNEKYAAFYSINYNKWLPLDEKSGSLKLSSLSPGKYNVGFKLVTDKEYFQEVSFTIAKPFWLSNLFLLLMFAVLLGVFYGVYRYKIAQKDKQNQMQLARVNLEKNLNLSKLKSIKSQMNPHFFYNALNTIQSYILASDKKQAVGYLSKFSALTRTILEMSENEFINLNEEIKMIGFYLDIEKARFNEDFDYQIITNGINKDEEIRIPSLLLQPYIENAIKHGLLHKEGQKELSIIFNKTENVLKVVIDDNGIGRHKSAELNKIKNNKHQSFATGAIQNRVDLLNQELSCKINIEYLDKASVAGNSLGTKVTIEIPLIN